MKIFLLKLFHETRFDTLYEKFDNERFTTQNRGKKREYRIILFLKIQKYELRIFLHSTAMESEKIILAGTRFHP